MKVVATLVALVAAFALAAPQVQAQQKDTHKHKPGEKHSKSEKGHKHKPGEKHSDDENKPKSKSKAKGQ